MATAVEVARLKLKMAKQKQRYMGMMNPALTTVVSNTAQDRHNEPHTIIIKVQKEEKVPKFDGQPDSVEPYCAALTTALAMMKGKGYKDPEGELLNKLSTGMETNVSKMWFSTLLEQGMPKTLSVYCDKVRASFVQQTSYLNKDLELGKLKQGSEETISLYALRLQTKAKKLGIDSESDTAKLSFLRGLENQKVKQATGKVLAGRLGMMKLEELVKAANTNYSLQAMDYSMGNTKQPPPAKQQQQLAPAVDPKLLEALERMEEELRDLKRTQQQQQQQQQRPPQQSQQERYSKRGREEKWCENHQTHGHNTADCLGVSQKKKFWDRGRGRNNNYNNNNSSS